MQQENIEQLKKEFMKKFNKQGFSNYDCTNFRIGGPTFKEIWPWIEKALKENTEQTIQAMLVEEREVKRGFDTTKTLIEKSEDDGHNQCCAKQRELEKKLKEQLDL